MDFTTPPPSEISKTENKPDFFTSQPSEMIEKIVQYLDYSDLVRLAKTNRRFRNFFAEFGNKFAYNEVIYLDEPYDIDKDYIVLANDNHRYHRQLENVVQADLEYNPIINYRRMFVKPSISDIVNSGVTDNVLTFQLYSEYIFRRILKSKSHSQKTLISNVFYNLLGAAIESLSFANFENVLTMAKNMNVVDTNYHIETDEEFYELLYETILKPSQITDDNYKQIYDFIKALYEEDYISRDDMLDYLNTQLYDLNKTLLNVNSKNAAVTLYTQLHDVLFEAIPDIPYVHHMYGFTDNELVPLYQPANLQPNEEEDEDFEEEDF